MSVVQISGFAILLDRRHSSWQELTAAFYKIVSQFPGHIKEVFLLYKYPEGELTRLRQNVTYKADM